MLWYNDLKNVKWLAILMSMYLRKDRQGATQVMTASKVMEKNLTGGVEGIGQKLYLDNCISSSDLFVDLHRSTIICLGTVRQNCIEMLLGFDSKTPK
jgi:hypothetical protein